MGSKVIATTSLPYKIVRPNDCPEKWDAYVRQHPKGSVFHLSKMIESINQTPKHQSLAFAALDSDDKMIGILAAAKVSTLNGMASRIASRSIWYAEPICDDSDDGIAAMKELIAEHDRVAKSHCLFTEIRPLFESGCERQSLEANGYELKDYLNYEVDTASDSETLFSAIGKSGRNKIKRSFRRGVTVEIDNSANGVERMYDLVQTTYTRSQVPLVDKQVFQNVVELLDDGIVQIRIAQYEGRDVAAGIGLVFNDRFFAWYGGSLREQGIVPFDCLTWNEIEWCSKNNIAVYDFGGAGWPDEEYGPREFKKKFGGKLVRYGRYRKVYSKLKLFFAESAYKMVRGLISR